MKKNVCLVIAVIILFSQISSALQLPFETASVGRVQGDSLGDLERALDVDSVSIEGADYYTSGDPGFGGSAIEGQTYNALVQNHGLNKVNLKAGRYWGFWDLKARKTPSDSALILQSTGLVSDSKVRAFDGSTSPPKGSSLSQAQIQQSKKLSEISLDDSIAGGNLVISDVDFAGTYLPSMGKQDSFSSQLAGKAGALIATNGISNAAMVKAIVCSLALQDKGFGGIEKVRKDYYYFNSLGDRFRNARNNLSEFGSGQESLVADYSLYGAPFVEANGKKYSGDYLKAICGDLAKYNTFPSQQEVAAQSFKTESDGPPVYTKDISLDFSEYSVVSDGGFEVIDINGASQRLSESEPVL